MAPVGPAQPRASGQRVQAAPPAASLCPLGAPTLSLRDGGTHLCTPGLRQPCPHVPASPGLRQPCPHVPASPGLRQPCPCVPWALAAPAPSPHTLPPWLQQPRPPHQVRGHCRGHRRGPVRAPRHRPPRRSCHPRPGHSPGGTARCAAPLGRCRRQDPDSGHWEHWGFPTGPHGTRRDVGSSLPGCPQPTAHSPRASVSPFRRRQPVPLSEGGV